MQQPFREFRERRRDPRRPAAFSFWFRRPQGHRRASAWMLNASAGGAAFLTVADDAPQLGERLELAEMHSNSPSVREEMPLLPAFARVLRVDDVAGPTRRIAVRFEADRDSGVPTFRRGQTGQQLTAPRRPQPAPPVSLPQREVATLATASSV